MTGTTLAFNPLVGTTVLIALAVILAGVIAYAALRRLPGWPWRERRREHVFRTTWLFVRIMLLPM